MDATITIKGIMRKITYPRTCELCNHTYKNCPNFSRHRKDCKRFQQAVDVDEVCQLVSIEDAEGDDDVAVRMKEIEQRNVELEKERNLAIQELALLKLQYTTVKSAHYVYLKEQWIYLCQTTHCFELHNNVFKIGRTLDMEKRKRGYPKGTIFFVGLRCIDAIMLENALIARFKLSFKPRKDYGNEYFEGSLSCMMKMMFDEYMLTVPENRPIEGATANDDDDESAEKKPQPDDTQQVQTLE